MPLSQLLVTASNSGQSLASGNVTPSPASLFTWPSPSVCLCVQIISSQKESSHWIRVPTNLNLNPSAETLFPNEVTSTHMGGGGESQLQHIFFEGNDSTHHKK